MKNFFLGGFAALLLALFIGVGLLYSGTFNVAADEPHSGLTKSLLEVARERSVAARAGNLQVPDLSDDALIASGAEHYHAMCTSCHLAPGMANTELRQGLYPMPPDLSEHPVSDSARAFWIIKHGVKLTGMPAWGTTHDDESIWGLVAFMHRLPELSAAEYESMTANADGHDHGGHSHGSHDHGETVEPERETAEEDGHSHNHNGETDAKGSHVHEEPDSATAVLDAFHHALEEGRGEVALQFLAPDAIVLEGGHAQSRKEYAGGHLASDMAFLAEMKSRRLSREVRESASSEQQATVVTRTQLQGTFQGKQLDIVTSETAVLAKRDGEWKIVHLHWSN